jgi:heat shock protein HslJ
VRSSLPLLALVLAGCAARPPDTVPRTVAYRCADNTGFQATFTAEGGSVTVGSAVLPHVRTASGTKYSDGTTTFWSKGGQATLATPDGVAITCRAIADPAWLPGTRWHLLRIESGDDSVLAPADPTRYTLEFGLGGELSGRADCNRIHGRWSADGSSMTLGPFAATRAACPPESISDRWVRSLEATVTWMRLEGGGLALSMKADGGVVRLEQEPLP